MTNEIHKADTQPSHHERCCLCQHYRHLLSQQSLCPQIRVHPSPQSGGQPLLWHPREIEQVFKGRVGADTDLLTSIYPIRASRGAQPGVRTWKSSPGWFRWVASLRTTGLHLTRVFKPRLFCVLAWCLLPKCLM